MSPPPTSKRRLADQRPASLRKKPKPRSPLERAFLVEDFAYRPASPRLLASDQVRAPRRAGNLQRPINQNGRDPFQYLGDDEVFLIISFLPLRATGVIRGVSKFWKATSEYHCGKLILLQNLPWAATLDLDDRPKQEINLQYRRELYHYTSLQRGWATRAFTLSGVHDWHLSNHALVWANGHDKASIRDFKDLNGISIDSEENDIRFGIDGKIADISETPYVQITRSGDLVVLHRTYDTTDGEIDDFDDPTRRRCPMSNDKLFKLSNDRVQWRLALDGSICRPAIGSKALYFLEQYNETYGPTFKKVDLATGAVIYETHPPEINETGLFIRQDQSIYHPARAQPVVPTRGRKVEIAQLDTSLKLAGNETMAVWIDLQSRAHVFATTNGQILMTYNRSMLTNLIVGAVNPQVWDTFPDPGANTILTVRLTKYNPRTENVEYAFSSGLAPAQEHALRFFDVDRPIAFDFSHGVPFLREGTRDPFTTIQIAGLEKKVNGERITLEHGGNLDGFEDTDIEQIFITLPAKPGQLEKRRPLEFNAPWYVGKDDFFGFVEGYLVYHNFTDKELILVDFWPTW